MFGIPGSHFLPHIVIRRSPEAGEVAGHLNRSLGRREEIEGESDASVQHGRRFLRSKHFLKADGYGRCAWIRVVNWQPGSGRCFEVCRCESIEGGALLPV